MATVLDKYPFLQELGITEINSGSCSGPDNWGPTADTDRQSGAAQLRLEDW